MKKTEHALQLRPLQASDIDRLAQIMADTALWQRHNVSKEKAALRLQSGLTEQASILVAEMADCPVGFVWFAARGAFLRSGYIMLIAVDGALRGQGVGHALMEHAETQLFASTNDIFLLVSDFNLQAQHFYRQRGYTQIGEIADYVTAGINEQLFRKQRIASLSVLG